MASVPGVGGVDRAQLLNLRDSLEKEAVCILNDGLQEECYQMRVPSKTLQPLPNFACVL